jgi:hypothetical protein
MDQERIEERDRGSRLMRKVTSAIATVALTAIAAVSITIGVQNQTVDVAQSATEETSGSSTTDSTAGTLTQPDQAPTASQVQGEVTSGGS